MLDSSMTGSGNACSTHEGFLDAIADPVYALNRDFCIIYANAAATRLFHTPLDALHGRSLWEVCPELADTAFAHTCRHALAQQQLSEADATDRATGTRFTHHFSPTADGLLVFARETVSQEGQASPANRCGAAQCRDDEIRQAQDTLTASEAYTQQQTIALEHQRELLQRIIETIPVMICIYDPNQQGFIFNRVMRETLGYTEADVADGRLLERLFPDRQYRQRVFDSVQMLEPGWRDFVTFTKQGQAIATSWTTIHLSDDTWIGIGFDSCERLRFNEAKDEFFALVSHELQTPLTSMLGWAELALEQDTLALYREAMPVVLRNARRQQRLINELLDMSMLLHGRLACRREPMDVGALVGQLIAQMRPQADANGIQLEWHPPAGPLPVQADPARLRQCLEHLFTNSLKFTPCGGTVTVDCRRNAATVEISIQDTGRGIAPEALPSLCTAFHQVDRDERAGGLGLGLAIVRGILELLNGSLEVVSPGLGQGCTVTVRLPLHHSGDE